MRDMKMRHKSVGVENPGHENAAQNCRVENDAARGKCGTKMQR